MDPYSSQRRAQVEVRRANHYHRCSSKQKTRSPFPSRLLTSHGLITQDARVYHGNCAKDGTLFHKRCWEAGRLGLYLEESRVGWWKNALVALEFIASSLDLLDIGGHRNPCLCHPCSSIRNS